MKNLIKRTLVLILALIMALPLVACGSKKPDDANTLEIYVYEQGYGVDWVNEIIKLFKEEDWVKEKYPQLNILKPVDNRTMEFGENQLLLGSNKNTYDLLFSAGIGSYYGSNELLDLTDLVYNETVPGESVTYAEKLNDSVEANYLYYDKKTDKEKFYAVPWQGGMSAILYNKTRLDDLGFDAPRTTDELIYLCANAKDANGKKIPAIIQSNDTQYCNVFLNTWWAQYDGVEGYENFYNGIDKNDQISNKIFSDYQGRLKALEVFEDLFLYKNGYIDSASYNDGFMTSQSNFLQGKKGLIHFNGDWFSQEMKVTIENLKANNRNVDDIRLLKTPIISAIVENCTTITGEAGGTADQELSALVKAIDENTATFDSDNNVYKGTGFNVSKTDYNTVYKARYVVNGTFGNTMGVIPSYAKGKDIAVDFVKFMATDKALAAYAKATLGSTLDFDFDLEQYDAELYNSFPQLNKDRLNYFKSGTIEILKPAGSFPLSVYGSVAPFRNTRYYQTFAATDGTSETPQSMFNKTIEYWTVSNFKTAKDNAGI